MTSSYINNIEYSRSLQERYEYYQAGLNFTLLAASIQTATFDEGKIQALLELSGWLCLLISGVIALLRFRMQPVAHKNAALLQKKKDILQKFNEGRAQGTREVLLVDNGELISIEQAIEETEQSIQKNEPVLKSLEGTLIKQHKWHLWLFIIGFVLVFLSRAYTPFIEIICYRLLGVGPN